MVAADAGAGHARVRARQPAGRAAPRRARKLYNTVDVRRLTVYKTGLFRGPAARGRETVNGE